MKMHSKDCITASIFKIIAICLITFLTFALPAFDTAAAAEVREQEQPPRKIDTWAVLQQAVDRAEPGEVISLDGNLVAGPEDTGIVIPAGKFLTLDLNGYTLNRNLTENESLGSVIRIDAGALLVIRDSSASRGGEENSPGTGMITGGYYDNGGGLLNRGTLILESGLIKGNKARDSGGGFLNDGTLVLLGGSVTGNEALQDGGGVFNKSKGHMTICGDIVHGNSAPEDDDITNQGTMTVIEPTPEDVRIEDMLGVRDYIERVALLPFLVILGILLYVTRIDSYLSKERKNTMCLIVLLVFTLIIQNYIEYPMPFRGSSPALRLPVSVYGYAIRPVILLLFIKVVKPDRRHTALWVLVAINAAIYMTAFFSKIAISFTPNGRWSPGPLHHTCTAVSALLLVYLFILTVQQFHPVQRKESWLPLFVIALIIGAIAMDFTLVFTEQPVTYLTMAIVIGSVFYYIWLHLQFVREHEKDLITAQRVQIMMTQIQPHFLFNALNTIRALYMKDTALADKTLENFSTYLRQNLESFDLTDMIPFSKELEHTRIYAEIEMLRFPDIRVEYKIEDENCFHGEYMNSYSWAGMTESFLYWKSVREK